MSTQMQRCPRSLLVSEKSNFDHEKSRYDTHVSKHYFNHKVTLFIPECRAITSHLASIINGFNKYYLVKNVPVYEFLDKEFLKNVVWNGAVYALSFNTRIDQDNTIALLPNRQLILSVDKDTYELLGLEGKPSQYNHRQVMRFVVTIDLTDKSMTPGEKRYERVLSSLKERVVLKSDFLLAQHNSGVEMESLLSRYQWTEHRPHVSTRTWGDLYCPTLHPSDLCGDQRSSDFLEWLGGLSVGGIKTKNTATSFLSTYTCPEPNNSVCQALQYTITGFLLPEDIYRLLQELRRYFDDLKFSSWLSLTVHGFMDSPVSWGVTEHGFHKGGEHFYSLVLFKNQDYWLHMCTGFHDGCPP